MEHDIILDLLPLYADDCCSQASRQAVQAHLAQCPSCRRALEALGTPLPTQAAVPVSPSRINSWKASILQSLLLFASFGLITLGVSMEAAVPSGLFNGFWAFTLVVPATGFLLSLTNWYFLRLYKNRQTFCLACCLVTTAVTALCFAWTLWHYEWHWQYLLSWARFHSLGLLFAAVLCGLSWPLAELYARYWGKD